MNSRFPNREIVLRIQSTSWTTGSILPRSLQRQPADTENDESSSHHGDPATLTTKDQHDSTREHLHIMSYSWGSWTFHSLPAAPFCAVSNERGQNPHLGFSARSIDDHHHHHPANGEGDFRGMKICSG